MARYCLSAIRQFGVELLASAHSSNLDLHCCRASAGPEASGAYADAVRQLSMTGDGPRTVEVRLHRIEGQVRGIARMINEGRTANEVLIQLRAIDSALTAVAGILTRDHVEHQVCAALKLSAEDQQQAVEEIVADVMRLSRS